MKIFKCRDATPMKFTLTTLSQSTNQTNNDASCASRFNPPFGSSCSRIRTKAKELKIIGDSMTRKEEQKLMLPKVNKESINKVNTVFLLNPDNVSHFLKVHKRFLNH